MYGRFIMNQVYFDLKNFNQTRQYLNTLRVQQEYGRYSINIRTGGYVKFDEIPTNNHHSHPNYEICLVLDGKGVFKHGEDRYEVEKGTLFLADPYIVHEISSFETRDLYLVFFTFDISKGIEELSVMYEDNLIEDFLQSHSIIVQGAEILFHYLPLINNNYLNKELTCRLFNEYTALKALIFEFLSILTKSQTRDDVLYSRKEEKLKAVVNDINNHINTKIKVKDLAGRHYISERNLRRLFSKYYDKSIHQFIIERKMQIASSKLLMDFKVSEAARAIGMEDISYFSRCFKKYYGISPRDYKNNHAN